MTYTEPCDQDRKPFQSDSCTKRVFILIN